LKTGTRLKRLTEVKEMFENRNEDLRTALNNEVRDTIKSDSLRRS
jgi:hypothetical protein